MTRSEMMRTLRDEQVKSLSMEHQYAGVRKLYDAAIAMNNSELSDTYRTQLHQLLDEQLDNASVVMNLTKKLFLEQN